MVELQKFAPRFSCVILAAGKGTRMKSNLPKVMHKVAGMPMIAHVVSAITPLSPQKTVIIISPKMPEVQDYLQPKNLGLEFAVQNEQLGTAHAVLCTKKNLATYKDKILILYGDTPLITTKTLRNLLNSGKDEATDITVLGMKMQNPTGYGRLLTDESGKLHKIIEENDANDAEKAITLCNSGVMIISGKHIFSLLKKIQPNNNAGEFYLTDIIKTANEQGLNCKVVVAEAEELAGVNTRSQLANAELTIQQRLREKFMAKGVTLTHPDSVFFQADTQIASDVIIHPNVVFGAGVSIETGVEIRSFSHIEGAEIKENAIVGPFARLRTGSVIGENVHIGNFVEVKNSNFGDGAKANHLSYIGDAQIGKKANIGAGTITCNYDGVHKHKTTIGDGAFIGSNSALVAPVTIGKNAIVGAGSVINKYVADDSLAIARAIQVNKTKKILTKKD